MNGDQVMERAEFEMLLAEGFHTGCRKASSHPKANEIWHAIQALPARDWGSVIEFVTLGFPTEDFTVAAKPKRKRKARPDPPAETP
jgi:hypothetical protein